MAKEHILCKSKTAFRGRHIGASLRLTKALVIGISQSDESTHIVEVVARAGQAGALTVDITNQDGSQLSKTAEYTLLCQAGLERSVAATKTYTTTCAVLAMLSAHLSGGESLREGIEQIPELAAAALKSEESVRRVAELLAPIPYIIPGQILANYLALHKGLNPDQPRGLTKITRTR